MPPPVSFPAAPPAAPVERLVLLVVGMPAAVTLADLPYTTFVWGGAWAADGSLVIAERNSDVYTDHAARHSGAAACISRDAMITNL